MHHCREACCIRIVHSGGNGNQTSEGFKEKLHRKFNIIKWLNSFVVKFGLKMYFFLNPIILVKFKFLQINYFIYLFFKRTSTLYIKPQRTRGFTGGFG